MNITSKIKLNEKKELDHLSFINNRVKDSVAFVGEFSFDYPALIPEVLETHSLINIEEVFAFFKPNIEVELKINKTEYRSEKIYFVELSDFRPDKIVSKFELLINQRNGTKIEKELFEENISTILQQTHTLESYYHSLNLFLINVNTVENLRRLDIYNISSEDMMCYESNFRHIIKSKIKNDSEFEGNYYSQLIIPFLLRHNSLLYDSKGLADWIKLCNDYNLVLITDNTNLELVYDLVPSSKDVQFYDFFNKYQYLNNAEILTFLNQDVEQLKNTFILANDVLVREGQSDYFENRPIYSSAAGAFGAKLITNRVSKLLSEIFDKKINGAIETLFYFNLREQNYLFDRGLINLSITNNEVFISNSSYNREKIEKFLDNMIINKLALCIKNFFIYYSYDLPTSTELYYFKNKSFEIGRFFDKLIYEHKLIKSWSLSNLLEY